MDIYTGALQLKGKDFSFVFDEKNLRLIPEDKGVIHEWIHREIVKGVYTFADPLTVEEPVLAGHCNETGNELIFLVPEGSGIDQNNGIFTIHPLAYIVYKYKRKPISGISFTCQELDWIFPVGSAYKVQLGTEGGNHGIQSIMSKDFCDVTTNEQSFEFQKREVKTYISISRFFNSGSRSPLEFASTLFFEFEETEDYLWVYGLIDIAIRFIRFLCNRQNIAFDSIVLSSREDDTQIDNAKMYLIGRKEEDDQSRIEHRNIRYQYIEGYEGRILQEITNSTVYLRHLPISYRLGQTINAATFVMITAAFEWEFRKLFPDGVEKNKKLIDAEDKAKEILDGLITANTGELKGQFKFMRKLVGNDSLSSEIIYTGKELNDILEPLGNRLYGMNNQTFKYSEIGDRVSKQRNDFAHGNLDQEFDPLALLDIMFFKEVVYVMQLKRFGLSDRNILESINSLFNQRVFFGDNLKETDKSSRFKC